MALTLVEASKLGGTELQKAVIEMYAKSSDILRVLPFSDIAGNALQYNREGTLPGIGFRGVNEGYSESVGAYNPVTEALAIAGGDADVDAFIIKTVPNSRGGHVAMKIKKLADAWTTKFIKGDVTSDPREFDGLQRRVTGGQLIPAGATPNGDALSMYILDQAIDAVDNPTHILMSKAMRRRLTQAARLPAVSGNVNFSVDEFGRQITMYNGLPVLVPYAVNGGTEPLAFDEACPGGGTATGQSIYVLSLGEGKLGGIQNGTIDARDLGEQDAKPVYRTRVEWYASIALWHGRAVSRLWGIKDAAFVA